MKKILITGVSGFIGRNMKEELRSSYVVVGRTRQQLDLLDDQSVQSFFKKYRFDIILHCATHNDTRNSPKDISKTLYVNLLMFFNLVRCQEYFGRMFYFGTGAEYDTEHYISKMSEAYFDRHVPKHEGAFSKYVMAKYTQQTQKIYEMRLFGCFGKYEDWQIRFISNACCKALYNMNITMRQNTFIDYFYIDDLIRITKIFIEKKRILYKQYNICTGNPIDLVSIAKTIISVSGRNVQIDIATPGLKAEYSGNNTRLMGELRNFHFTPIETAITKLYRWYERRKKLIPRNLLLYDK